MRRALTFIEGCRDQQLKQATDPATHPPASAGDPIRQQQQSSASSGDPPASPPLLEATNRRGESRALGVGGGGSSATTMRATASAIPSQVTATSRTRSGSCTPAVVPTIAIRAAKLPQRGKEVDPALTSSSSTSGSGQSSSLVMPPLWRKASRHYEDTLQRAIQQVTAYSAAYVGISPPLSPHLIITDGLKGSINESVKMYGWRLASFCESRSCTNSNSNSRGRSLPIPGNVANASVLDRRKEAQKLFAAVVAAQTWILNALRQLAIAPPSAPKSSGPSVKAGSSGNGRTSPSASEIMGISAEGLYRLLQDLRVARMQLSEAMDDLEASPGVEVSSSIKAHEQEPAKGGQEDGSGSAKANRAPSDGIWQPSQDLVQSSVRWRNRFLRALKAAAEGRSGAGAASSAHPISVVTRASERVRNTPQSSITHHNVASHGQPSGSRARPPHSPHGGGVSGSAQGSSSSQTRNLRNPAALIRPLGIWLPDSSWGSCHIVNMNRGGSDLPPQWSLALPGSGLPPQWSLALPGSDLPPQWSLALPATLTTHNDSLSGGGAARPISLSCPDTQHAMAHGHAVQQLQQCLMQLHLEGTLAAALVPAGRPPPAARCTTPHHGTRESNQPGVRVGRGHQHIDDPHVGWDDRQAEARLDRHLAMLRLAHVFLSKGAWNKRCSIVEVIEE